MSNFLDAALRVMSPSRPMTAREISEAAIRRGLIQTRGKTPEATLTAALYLEAKTPRPRVRRVFNPGPTRAQRNSVHWLLAERATKGLGTSTPDGCTASSSSEKVARRTAAGGCR
jgi:hypothetical protein